jgi:hypothetical protein
VRAEAAFTVSRTCVSDRTLQEQTIISASASPYFGTVLNYCSYYIFCKKQGGRQWARFTEIS